MGKLLRVLIIEDSEDDFLLLLRQLRKGGYDPEYERVETAEPMEKALREKSWDVVLCDYKLPHFSGFEALSLFNKSGIDIPFIIVSGTIGEETAVAAMRAGARDYVMKDKLSRIVPAIERELKEAESRKLRRIYEHELFKSEANLAAIMNSSNDWIWSVDTDNFGLLTFNRALEEYFMHHAGICIQKGMTPEDLLPPERVTEWRNFYRRVLMDGSYEMEYKTVRGTSVFLMSFNPVIHDGRISAISVLGKDITDRKLAEEALRASEQRLSDIIEFFPDATMVIDREGRVIFWNRAMEAMTGVKSENILGRGDYEYAIPFYGVKRPILIDLALRPEPEMEKLYTAFEKRGDIVFGEAFAPNLPGGQAHLSATASTLRDANGDIVAAIECVRDNTERKRVQEELREAEERYRSIFENAQEGIFRSTPEGKIFMANAAMARIFGYESPEELTAAVTDAAHQIYVNSEERAKIIQQIEERGFIKNHETQLYRKDGSVFWVSMTMRAVRDAEGRILFYEGIDEDITERKEHFDLLRKTLGAAVQAIASVVERKDPYTAGHQRRVADLARAIATEMRLPGNQIDGLRIAASIHDIGKISVPAEILSMPRKLTEIEMSLIKSHPQSGYDILKDIDFPWPVAQIVLQHHERLDGSGYPLGLKGSEIMPEVRILAVADVVEAIVSHRPYRPALGLNLAIDEISKNRGILYDPDVVAACLKLLTNNQYILAA